MVQKETKFKLGDREYTLKFSMRVPLYWEQASKKNYFVVFGPGSKPTLTDILTLVWAAFKNGGCTLSLEELTEQLSDKDLQALSGKVMGLAAENSTAAEPGERETPLAGKPQH